MTSRLRLSPGALFAALLGVALAFPPGSVLAQGGRGPTVPPVFLGGVPSGSVDREPLRLTLADAVARGLDHNLGALLAEQGIRAAEGTRGKALADLLPQVSGDGFLTRQTLSLAAFGFSFPGTPTIIGPFQVLDVRAKIKQSIFDWSLIEKKRAASSALEASRQSYQDARGLVVLVCGNLYLQAVALESRVAAVLAQVEAAHSIAQLAEDRHKAGSVPGIDALRSQVQLQSQEQRLIAARNDQAKQKLALARAIGLPPGQEIELVDKVPYAQLRALPLAEALQIALATRADVKAAQARVEAAKETLRSVRGEALPSVVGAADYGEIGNNTGNLNHTFAYTVGVHVPLFEGGKVEAKAAEASAALEQRQAELADLLSRTDFEVRSALLDLDAAAERVGVADASRGLAEQALLQAKDRFSAGAAGSIEVVQAQEAVATAEDSYISSLYDHNAAKASLALALGVAEPAYLKFLRGESGR
ncbi:MAG TPA: TolC family protein [Thermoanaerobaculia bacterium]|nr:TolC family protein [Thermoanaerobaculia bacterium]